MKKTTKTAAKAKRAGRSAATTGRPATTRAAGAVEREYTITFPRSLWRQARALAILRGQENQEFILAATERALGLEEKGRGPEALTSEPVRSDDMAAYTFRFPGDVYQRIKMMLARRIGTQQGQDPTIRAFLHTVVREELAEARRSGEMVTRHTGRR